jgi:glycine reductase complex component B subunit gamma
MAGKRVVHYLNQFFGGVGGEEKTDLRPTALDGPVGPGRLLHQCLAGEAEVVGTVLGGDVYMAERGEEAAAEAARLIATYDPDVVVAGPAFDAGRYGVACGAVCRAVRRELGRPAVMAMTPSNPAVALYRDVYVLPTGASAADMARAMPALARLGLKLGRGEELGPADEEGYLPRGVRRYLERPKPAYERATDMLLARLHGRPWASEVGVHGYERVPPAAPLGSLHDVTIGLVTSGGLVPKGNPDRLPSGNVRDFFRYSIAGLDALSVGEWECVHGGFLTNVVNTHNPAYVLPLPVLRAKEQAGEIGSLHPYYFATVGNGTAVTNAKRFGQAIARQLKEAGVRAVVLVAT